jgi:hypothetical protein
MNMKLLTNVLLQTCRSALIIVGVAQMALGDADSSD